MSQPALAPRFCRLVLHALILSSLFALACSAQTETTTTSRTLASGITLTQQITTGNAPLIVNILRVDLKAPGVKVRCGIAQDAINPTGPIHGLERVNSLAARNGAVAAVNADFFPFRADPVGIAIRDGELLSEPLEYRACVGFLPDGILMDVLIPVGTWSAGQNSGGAVDGINRVPEQDETVVLTPAFTATPKLGKPGVVVTLRGVNLPLKPSRDMQGHIDAITTLDATQTLPACPSDGVLLVACGNALPRFTDKLQAGDTLNFRFDLVANDPPPQRGKFPSRAGFLRGMTYKPLWTNVEQAVSGGPWLVKNGRVAVDDEAEAFERASFVASRHARTAIGVTGDGILLLVTVDKRALGSVGASLDELANLMLQLGAFNAINLDGGGSTTMSAAGGVVNAPSDGHARPIADALLVYGNTPAVPDADALIVSPNSPDGVTLTAGDTIPFAVTRPNGDTLPADSSPVVWGTSEGLGFISQLGVFRSSVAGTGKIMANIGTRQIVVPVHVLPGPPAKIKANLVAVANNPPDRLLLTVTVLDRFGNPVAGQNVTAEVKGGQLEAPLATNSAGQASAEVVWDAPPGQRAVTLTVGSAPAVTVRK